MEILGYHGLLERIAPQITHSWEVPVVHQMPCTTLCRQGVSVFWEVAIARHVARVRSFCCSAMNALRSTSKASSALAGSKLFSFLKQSAKIHHIFTFPRLQTCHNTGSEHGIDSSRQTHQRGFHHFRCGEDFFSCQIITENKVHILYRQAVS